jgi:hypothetical protein
MFIHINQTFGYMPEDIKESINAPILKKIPDYGDHMTRESFLSDVEDGGFIDYDGHGHLATADQETNWIVKPSTANEPWPEWATHVVWYNR